MMIRFKVVILKVNSGRFNSNSGNFSFKEVARLLIGRSLL